MGLSDPNLGTEGEASTAFRGPRVLCDVIHNTPAFLSDDALCPRARPEN